MPAKKPLHFTFCLALCSCKKDNIATDDVHAEMLAAVNEEAQAAPVVLFICRPFLRLNGTIIRKPPLLHTQKICLLIIILTTYHPADHAWKKSEDHCKAMMDSLYVDFGAARYNTIWVQEFGR